MRLPRNARSAVVSYAGAGAVAFQSYDSATNALTNLADSPGVGDHSTLVVVSSPE